MMSLHVGAKIFKKFFIQRLVIAGIAGRVVALMTKLHMDSLAKFVASGLRSKLILRRETAVDCRSKD